MLRAKAHAKINLHLHITDRAPNGYHHLDSLVAFADVHDTLDFSPAPFFQFHAKGDYQGLLMSGTPVADNLVTRVATMLTDFYNRPLSVRIDLEKSIPLGAGLGGGSADAAATLKALSRFYGLNASNDVLHLIASRLGSDIAACLYDKPVILRDTGNTLLPAPIFPEIYGVLANPQTACPTPLVYQAYAALGRPFSQPVTFPEKFDNASDLFDFLVIHTANDLTEAAIAVNGDVKTTLNTLESLPDCKLARLSGSGSTCFGLFATRTAAEMAATILQDRYPAWWIKASVING